MNFKFIFSLLVILVVSVSSREVYKVCSGDGNKEACIQMQRGNSEVACQWVQDNIECAKRILNKTVDFGMFSAESMLQLAILKWDNLQVVQSFAHKERLNEDYDYASVAIVRKGINGFDGLKGKKYCHPGYESNPNERWTERFLKYFERKVAVPNCNVDIVSPADIEARTVSDFFGPSCRPGLWSFDVKEDAELKKRYPSLCKLCPQSNCKYTTNPEVDKNHENALKCLVNGGDVAYVSLQEAQKFFNSSASANVNDFEYLCEGGNTQPLNTPCTWLRQPWKGIIAHKDEAKDVQKRLKEWTTKGLSGVGWEAELRKVLKIEDDRLRQKTLWDIKTPEEYIKPLRPIPNESYCNIEIKWCTTSKLEQEKCEVAKAGGISTGIYPKINCRPSSQSMGGSVVECLQSISRNDSDFMGIDSNYGALARMNFNLSAALFFETEMDQYSSIVVVVREDSSINKFKDLKGKKACIPEYGSSTAVALVNKLKEEKLIDRNGCKYGQMLSDFFGNSCFPGAEDFKYIRTGETNHSSLCSLCFEAENHGSHNGGGNWDENINVRGTKNDDTGYIEAKMTTCAADKGNRYFGNRGGLMCLNEVGEVAVLELQSLREHAEQVEIDEYRFRMLCRNDTIAKKAGFDVDLDCALTTVVDGEIIMYRQSPKTASVVHTLRGLEHYFLRKNDPSFKIYNIFEGQRNILFKDSTIGLTSNSEDDKDQSPMVMNYKKLFKDVEKCAGNSAMTITVSFASVISLICIKLFF